MGHAGLEPATSDLGNQRSDPHELMAQVPSRAAHLEKAAGSDVAAGEGLQ